MLYLPITKTWIVSAPARRVYFVCALAAFSLFGVLVESRAARTAAGAASFTNSPSAVLTVKLLLWSGILGSALLSVAMWYFWFGFDDSSWIKKAFWFLPLYFLLLLGPACYYFLVYRRRTASELRR